MPWHQPWHWSLKPDTLITDFSCFFFSIQGIYVGKSSGSKTIQSPNYRRYYDNSCSYEIETAEGYVLRLTFVRMSISSCSGCSCGYVQVYEGSNGKYSSGSSLLGKFCNGHYPTTVTTRSNKMSVYFYSDNSYNTFQATVISEKGNSSLFCFYFLYFENCVG